MKLRGILIVVSILMLIITMLPGCSVDKWLEVNEGNYIPVFVDTRGHDSSGINQIVSITVDRGKETVEISLTDGAIVSVPFTARPDGEWPSGCPGNIGSTRMEVLDIDVDDLAVGNIVIKNPVLVRNCPENPERLILRGDGEMGGSSTACAGNNICVHFKPATPGESL